MFAAPAPVTDPPTDLAERCDTSKCQLPYCFCSRDGTIIPGGLQPEDVRKLPSTILLIIFCKCNCLMILQKYTSTFLCFKLPLLRYFKTLTRVENRKI